jgi:hypothetical protein
MILSQQHTRLKVLLVPDLGLATPYCQQELDLRGEFFTFRCYELGSVDALSGGWNARGKVAEKRHLVEMDEADSKILCFRQARTRIRVSDRVSAKAGRHIYGLATIRPYRCS